MSIEEKRWLFTVLFFLFSIFTALFSIFTSIELGNKFRKRKIPDVERAGRKRLIWAWLVAILLLVIELPLLQKIYGYSNVQIIFAFLIDIAVCIFAFILSYCFPSLSGTEELEKRKEKMEQLKIKEE